MLTIHHAGLSDRGRIRPANEDRWAADPELSLYLVADGLGGERGGAAAAQLVADVLPARVRQALGCSKRITPLVEARLTSALVELSEQVRATGEASLGLPGMGSTVVLALIRDGYASIAHLGDSRAYRMRRTRLDRLTHDHSLVQLLLDGGDITPADAARHPARGKLTRYLGMPGEALPEVRRVEVRPGDRLLLCSDGLTGAVEDGRLSAVLRLALPPRVVCQRLVAAANDGGGDDNITAVVLDLSDE